MTLTLILSAAAVISFEYAIRCRKNSKERITALERKIENIIKCYDSQVKRLCEEKKELITLMYRGCDSIKIRIRDDGADVIGAHPDDDMSFFVIKSFTAEDNTPDEMEFAVRQAEELAETIINA